MDNQNYSLINLPSDLYPQIFNNFSPLDFLIFTQSSRKVQELVLKYEDIFWKGFCLAEKHAAWSKKTLSDIKKDESLNWKQVYIDSEAPFYAFYMRQRDLQELKIGPNIKHNDCKIPNIFKKWTGKSKLVENEIPDFNRQLHFRLTRGSNVEKMIVSLFGKERFNQIPLLKDEFDARGLPFDDEVMLSGPIYRSDLTFPSIVRGESFDGKKFLFARIKHLQKKNNEHIGNYFNFCFSVGHSFFDQNEMQSVDPSGFGFKGKILSRIKCSTLDMLQGLLETGFFDLSKKTKLHLDFQWK